MSDEWPYHLERQAMLPAAEKIVLLAGRHAAGVRLVHDTAEEEEQVVYINKRICSVLEWQ